MELYYWGAQGPNLGDSLNPWLWPILLPGFFDDDPSEIFIGIGSNFGHSFPPHVKKLVCGTGYGGYQAAPEIDDTWDIRFVRGPRTAQMLGLDKDLALGDPGMLIHLAGAALPEPTERHAIGFMPHWESAFYGAWDAVCEEAGAHFIDPRGPLESVIAAIRGCDLLVTEAMHGAIVGDALRIPWVPFMPLATHHFKWYDWAESQGITIEFSRSTRSTWLEQMFDALHGRDRLQAFVCAKGMPVRSFGSGLLRARACAALQAAASARSYLISDTVMGNTTDAMLERIDRLKPANC